VVASQGCQPFHPAARGSERTAFGWLISLLFAVWIGASLFMGADLEQQPIQVLLVGSFEELAHVFRKFMVFKHSNPRNQRPSRTWFQSNGKFEKRQVDMFDPNQ
jgi:hypothetical protein